MDNYPTWYIITSQIALKCVVLFSLFFWRNFSFSLSTVGCVVCWVVLFVQVASLWRGYKNYIDKIINPCPSNNVATWFGKWRCMPFFYQILIIRYIYYVYISSICYIIFDIQTYINYDIQIDRVYINYDIQKWKEKQWKKIPLNVN